MTTPPPGTLGARLAELADMDPADVDVGHLLAEHAALAAAHRQLRDDMALIREVFGAHVRDSAIDDGQLLVGSLGDVPSRRITHPSTVQGLRRIFGIGEDVAPAVPLGDVFGPSDGTPDSFHERIDRLTDLVCEAFIMLATEDTYDPSDWLDRAGPIVGEAT